MKATSIEAGFDIDKHQKGDKDIIKLYNCYGLSKESKQAALCNRRYQMNCPPRHSQTKCPDQDVTENTETCARRGLTVPRSSQLFTFTTDESPSTRNSEFNVPEAETKKGKRLTGSLGPCHTVPRSACSSGNNILDNKKNSSPSVGSKTKPASTNRLRKKLSHPTANPLGLRISNPHLDKASKKSDEDPASPEYSPTDNNESDDDLVKTNQPPLHTNTPSEKRKTLRKRMCNKKFQLNSSDSENNLLLPEEETHSSLPSSQQSSEDTLDLHGTPNFQTSPIIRRATTGSILFPDSEDKEESEPVSFPGLKRRKGKSRAENQEHPSKDEEGFCEQQSMLGCDRLSSNHGTPIVNGIEEEWDAGNLFGEGLGLPFTSSLLGFVHFRSEIVDLRSLSTDNAQQITSLSNKFDVFTDLLQESLKQREPTRSNKREPVRQAFGDSTVDDSPSQPARAFKIRVLIENLIGTLHGPKKEDKMVPHGATPAEKRDWMANISIQELLNKAHKHPGSNQPSFPQTADPIFPYPGGPGGKKASHRSLQIMWDVMQRVGVRSFCPDYSELLGCPGNVLKGRLAYVTAHKSLWTLSKVVEQCCSNDETDYEDKGGRKHCKVCIIQWRSSQLNSIFKAIDEARVRNNPIKTSPGVQARIRHRSFSNPISDLAPPDEIHKDCISQAYYEQLDETEKAEIKIINKSILRPVKEMIAKKLLPCK
ncbi:uncharacterized protein MELLADRAFT_104028 [Melampsora larici-populina 98AG31]|uniref:Uncharacterized protein n=1 Tax=Melampsora larici-populina (strain 98AG31 / pathotype 3-4-7) TaxID=747676 RepID=F4RDB7_MELLP|nr:uncharacterized protein MELLADRAFT_104028 [Melampsora larici-populina 98AG31]EGG09637.1 hypothetical protein MELLADRAFT_104028 [Melampsora larici-populina 98AG31]